MEPTSKRNKLRSGWLKNKKEEDDWAKTLIKDERFEAECWGGRLQEHQQQHFWLRGISNANLWCVLYWSCYVCLNFASLLIYRLLPGCIQPLHLQQSQSTLTSFWLSQSVYSLPYINIVFGTTGLKTTQVQSIVDDGKGDEDFRQHCLSCNLHIYPPTLFVFWPSICPFLAEYT